MGNIQLAHRPEQYLLDDILIPIFKKHLITAQQEVEILVSHPEISPTPYLTRIDNFYSIKSDDGFKIDLCIDLHGSWHEKKHVQVWDANKRLALHHHGKIYLELSNAAPNENVPSLYQAVEIKKKIDKFRDKATTNDNKYWNLVHDFEKMMINARIEVLQQVLVQLLIFTPNSVKNFNLHI